MSGSGAVHFDDIELAEGASNMQVHLDGSGQLTVNVWPASSPKQRVSGVTQLIDHRNNLDDDRPYAFEMDHDNNFLAELPADIRREALRSLYDTLDVMVPTTYYDDLKTQEAVPLREMLFVQSQRHDETLLAAMPVDDNAPIADAARFALSSLIWALAHEGVGVSESALQTTLDALANADVLEPDVFDDDSPSP